jgi:hypothetical protein
MARLEFTIAYPDGYPKGKYTITPTRPLYPEGTIVDVEYTIVEEKPLIPEYKGSEVKGDSKSD